MKVVFLGTPELAATCLEGLLAVADRHAVVAVVTNPDRPVGRHGDPRPPPVKLVAQRAGVPVLQPESVRTAQLRQELAASGAEVGVTVAYGHVLGAKLLACLPRGFLNAHASLLPRWRGASPIQAALLAGDPRTGVTIMEMNEGLDTGDMLLWEAIDISPRETAATLHDRLAGLAARMLPLALDRLAAGDLARLPQERSPFGPPTTCGILTKEDGRIDWTASAAAIDRQVRAFDPWPGCHTELGGERVLVRAGLARERHGGAAVAPRAPGTLRVEDGRLLVACGEGEFEVTELQRGGRRACSAAEFLRGTSLAEGARFA